MIRNISFKIFGDILYRKLKRSPDQARYFNQSTWIIEIRNHPYRKHWEGAAGGYRSEQNQSNLCRIVLLSQIKARSSTTTLVGIHVFDARSILHWDVCTFDVWKQEKGQRIEPCFLTVEFSGVSGYTTDTLLKNVTYVRESFQDGFTIHPGWFQNPSRMYWNFVTKLRFSTHSGSVFRAFFFQYMRRLMVDRFDSPRRDTHSSQWHLPDRFPRQRNLFTSQVFRKNEGTKKKSRKNEHLK